MKREIGDEEEQGDVVFITRHRYRSDYSIKQPFGFKVFV
jgi:hypothetical protein